MAAEFGQAAHNLYKGGIQSASAVKKFAELVRRCGEKKSQPGSNQDIAHRLECRLQCAFNVACTPSLMPLASRL